MSRRADFEERGFVVVPAFLDAGELAEVNGHIDAINRIMMRTPRRPGTRLISLVLALFPRSLGRRALGLPADGSD